MPVSVRGESKKTGGSNKVSTIFSRLGTDIADPVERLKEVSAANHNAKDHHKTIPADTLQDWAEFAAPRTFGLAVRMVSSLGLADNGPVIHNLVISNVPGPPVPLFFMGARIEGLYPLGPIFHGAGLNITVMSSEARCTSARSAVASWCPAVEPDREVPGGARGAVRRHVGQKKAARRRREEDRREEGSDKKTAKKTATKKTATKKSRTKKSAPSGERSRPASFTRLRSAPVLDPGGRDLTASRNVGTNRRPPSRSRRDRTRPRARSRRGSARPAALTLGGDDPVAASGPPPPWVRRSGTATAWSGAAPRPRPPARRPTGWCCATRRAPTCRCRWGRCRAPRPSTGWPSAGPGLRQGAQGPHRDLHAGVEDHLATVGAEVVGGRGEDQAADEVGVLSPDPLGDDRAHRVARNDRTCRARAR